MRKKRSKSLAWSHEGWWREPTKLEIVELALDGFTGEILIGNIEGTSCKKCDVPLLMHHHPGAWWILCPKCGVVYDKT